MTESTSTIDETVPPLVSQGVGQLLRETRNKAGLEIVEVARVLRISQRYLEALEEGRDAELPGSTYAIGFVRSYSEYLKLDGEEIVRRYKAEAKGNGVKSVLIFPKPIPDSGVPGAAVLGLGIIVAAVAYGVWYWNSNADDVMVMRVEPVPEQLLVPAEPVSPAPSPEMATPPDASVTEPASEQSAETTAEAQPTTAAAAAPEAVAPAPENSTQAKPAATEPPATEPTAAAATTAEQPVATEPVAADAAAVEPVAKTEAEVAAVELTAPAPQEAAPTANDDDGPSRITVRAKANSWIQIRDEALDRLLFTRLLREGDLYEVPNRAGLSLMTGNAGALELVVDGEVIPTIGQIGEVRRNVELDPEKLKTGTAITE